MNDYENAIEVNGLTKHYDGFTLDNISFSLPRGSIMGFIGQNGAGKTTTINSLLGIIGHDGGSIKMLGLDTSDKKNMQAVREDISAVFDELPLHEELNANHINIIMRDIYKGWDSGTYFAYLDRFNLPRKKPTGQFSKGMKMKLQIAIALSHNAKLLIMDEATTGLDPVVRNEILDIFLEYLQDDSRSILMSSHITSDLEKIADSVTFIDNGKILLTGYKDDILFSHGLLRCTKAQFAALDPSEYVSARISDFGASVMVSDIAAAKAAHPDIAADPAALDEIMMYYVNRTAKEWS